jgi:pimeloyl-ACP methyl ester carboxylesterase
MSVPTLEGIAAATVTTPRLTTRVLTCGPADAVPVVFLHGNLSSATWWEETMLALPDGYRAIAPDQRGFGDADPAVVVDATKGMQDYVDDVMALAARLGIDRFHLVGNSLGGVIAWWVLAADSARLLSLTQADPGSPYGFGGTKDTAGTPTYHDFAGSGPLANPELVKRIAAQDRGTESPLSPRAALRALVWKPPFIPEREDAYVDSLLQVHLGEQAYPGDLGGTANWPFVAPGAWGVNNALSPKYVGDLVDRMVAAEPKPPVLWTRGADDLAVADGAASDPGTWGPAGLLPGYPGPEVYPPQPMLGQIRTVLDRYADRGGAYEEVVIDDSGHVPFIEKPEEFNSAFHAHLDNARK